MASLNIDLYQEENDGSRRTIKIVKIAYTNNGFWTTLGRLLIDYILS